MREILFRGKRKNNGEWIEGYFCGKYNETFFSPAKESAQIIDKDLYWHEVIPETVGQYTGLNDKNSKKIFEGDIVSITALDNDHFQKGERTTACIENYMGNSCICVYGGSSGVILSLYSILIDHTVEVIGNIHDNLELIGGDDNG